jgi:hypothetical protein
MTHGGMRAGAGRPKKPDALVTRAFSIRQDQDDWLEAQAINTGDSKSEIVRASLNAWMKRRKPKL